MTRAVHVHMLLPTCCHSEDPGLVSRLAKLEEADTADAAAAPLTRGEKAAVLGSATGLDRLMRLG